jgi:uncharacterized protein
VTRRVLVAGVSTRAMAESAARAGFDVTAIDAFADLDQHPSVKALSMARDFGAPFSAHAVARAAQAIQGDAAAYGSNFENHSKAIRVLASGRTLWGNPPPTLRSVRNPFVVAERLRSRGVAMPVCAAVPAACAAANEGADRWIVKPRASGGGHGVRLWSDRAHGRSSVPSRCYLQQYIAGIPGAIVFVAAARQAVPLAVSRQIIGDPRFGASGFRYCGSIITGAAAPQFDEEAMVIAGARAVASAVAEEFDLVGVNGVDFIARAGIPFPIEVNPRWSASMELAERAHGLSVFGVHAAACSGLALPAFDLAAARQGAGAIGKAIVYARHDVTVGDTRAWLDEDDVRDVPHPGDRIQTGRPVCTVFASGAGGEMCLEALARRAGRIYDQLAAWSREAA